MNTNTGNDDWNGQSATWDGVNGPKLSIKNATGTVTTGGTVNIANGQYRGENNTNITINNNMILKGASQTHTIINGTDTNQIFQISHGVNVKFMYLTLANGNSTVDGGAIDNDGNVTASYCKFAHNTAHNHGGAILNNGNLTLTNCIFKNNRAIDSYGGALENFGDNIIIKNCEFTDNSASDSDGGAMSLDDGTTTIEDSTFTNNYAQNVGGAIWNGEPLTITGCTFTGNKADDDGGAIVNFGLLTVKNSIFLRNIGENGGAIYNSEENMTIIGNNFEGNKATDDGGAISDYEGNLTIKFNRFYNNSAPNGTAINTYNSTIDARYNWWGSNAGPTVGTVVGTTNYSPWLILTVTANPKTVKEGEKSTITADVYRDSNGGDHSSQWTQFFSGAQVKFTTNLGQIGSKQITEIMNLGKAIATLTANEGKGLYILTATLDDQTMTTNVNVTAGTEVNAASNTVGMQETGIPINYLVLAVLMVIGGLLVPKRR